MQEKNKTPRVVIDTNIVISGTIFPTSLPGQLLKSFINGDFEWILTNATFREIRNVISREEILTPYHITQQNTQIFLDNLEVSAEFVTAIPLVMLPLHSRDPKDDILLSAAISGECEYLITGDGDLLVLSGRPELQKLTILTASEYLQRRKMK